MDTVDISVGGCELEDNCSGGGGLLYIGFIYRVKIVCGVFIVWNIE